MTRTRTPSPTNDPDRPTVGLLRPRPVKHTYRAMINVRTIRLPIPPPNMPRLRLCKITNGKVTITFCVVDNESV